MTNPNNDVELRYGYTFASLSGIARQAVFNSRWEFLPFHERYEVAWSAIAEELYASKEPPRADDLILAGARAIRKEVEEEGRLRGVYYHRSGKPGMPRFEAYWWSQASPIPSPENRIVESLAVRKIYESINPTHQQVLMALVRHRTYERAAQALGVTPKSFRTYISSARKEFRRRWHDDEDPSRFWGRDRPGKTRTDSVTATTIRRRRQRRLKQNEKMNRSTPEGSTSHADDRRIQDGA